MNINSIINELKYLSGENRLNIELPNDALIAKYEKEIGFIFSEDYKKVLKEVSN
ncbi:SMI1/KNR4 family protein, partial [Acinetobacter nectaris]